MHDRREIGLGDRLAERKGHHGCLRLAAAPPPHLGTGLHRHAIGHAMQPAAQRVAGADRARLARQHQEGGLERVLDVGLVLQDRTASGQDHRAVPRHQRLERRLLAIGRESSQELAVAQADGRAVAVQVAEVPQGASQRAAGHEWKSSPGTLVAPIRQRASHPLRLHSLQDKRGRPARGARFSRQGRLGPEVGRAGQPDTDQTGVGLADRDGQIRMEYPTHSDRAGREVGQAVQPDLLRSGGWRPCEHPRNAPIGPDPVRTGPDPRRFGGPSLIPRS